MGILPGLGATTERPSLFSVLAGLVRGGGSGSPTWSPPSRQPYGPGTGRAAYAVVQGRRAANKVARRSRRINRLTR